MIQSKKPYPSSRQVCQLFCPPRPRFSSAAPPKSLVSPSSAAPSVSSSSSSSLSLTMDFPPFAVRFSVRFIAGHFIFPRLSIIFLESDVRDHLEVSSNSPGGHGNGAVIKAVVLNRSRRFDSLANVSMTCGVSPSSDRTQ